MRRAVIALVVLVGARAAAAGDEMIADRPGLGESASVAPDFFLDLGFSRRF